VLKKFNRFLEVGEMPSEEKEKEEKKVEDMENEEVNKKEKQEKEDEEKPLDKIIVEDKDKGKGVNDEKKIAILKTIVTNIGCSSFDLLGDCFDESLLKNGICIAPCRDKKLKNTQSWSSNILIRAHFLLKQAGLSVDAK